jgi:hypothetical protein
VTAADIDPAALAFGAAATEYERARFEEPFDLPYVTHLWWACTPSS